jgi:hypothetical protein
MDTSDVLVIIMVIPAITIAYWLLAIAREVLS